MGYYSKFTEGSRISSRLSTISLYRRITCWIVILLFTVCGCTTAALSPTPNLYEDVSLDNLPLPVQKFHRRLDFVQAEYVFVATWYPRPYPDYFHVLWLSTDGAVASYLEIPDWAVQGGLQGELTAGELRGVSAALSHLADVHIPSTGKGAAVIALNFKSKGLVHIITCTEAECPQEIQDLFQIAEMAFQRQTPGVVVSSPFKGE